MNAIQNEDYLNKMQCCKVTALNEIIKKDFLSIKKVLLDEKEIYELCGSGYSEENLKQKRKEGKHNIEYIQLVKGSRVLYVSLSVYENLTDLTVANKIDWIMKRIRECLNIKHQKSFKVSQNQLAKLFGVTPSTIINYKKSKEYDFIKQTKDNNFLILDIAEWILKNSIKCV